MLKEETLMQTGRREYEEPVGEFLEMIGSGSNTITVLTRVDSDKVAGEEETLIDPSDVTVSELKEHLDGKNYSDNQLAEIHQRETEGDNRTTALNAIEEEGQW